MSDKIPTERLDIQNAAEANEEILAFADTLMAEGKEPRFEVRFPSPDFLSEDEKKAWLEKQEEVFDAVEVIEGEIRTLPPYAELESGE